ncbi:MAG TPA: cobalamin-dependent protein [Spirochaetota bacterium]|nr:cobalamin-dependent protein [Spirochaetota bacterium]
MKTLVAYLCDYRDRNDYFLSLMPVGAVSIAAALEARGHDVTLANYSREGVRSAAAHIQSIKPDAVGLSVCTHNRTDSLRLAVEIKKRLPKTIIIAGGPHAAFLGEEILRRVKAVDYVVRGEGELAFAELLARHAKKAPASERIVQGERIKDLDALPFPARFGGTMRGMDPNEQFKYIITSRGCPHRCAFCCSPRLWGRTTAFRSAEHIVDEIEHCVKTYGIIYFSIRDDNFTLRRERVLKFCRLLRERKLYIMWNCQSRVDTLDGEMLLEMKRAGLEHIQLGVESGSERILAMYDKRTTVADIEKASAAVRRAGAYLSFYLMAGMETERAADIKETIKLIRRTLPGDGIVSPVALYPGTALYDAVKARGDIDDSLWFRSKDNGIYLRDDAEVGRWVRTLADELGAIRKRSWYREKDFRAHRRAAGGNCWVTDILEGDFHLDGERHDRALERYRAAARRHPLNPWPFLRMGKARFMSGRYQEAERDFAFVTEIVPKFYGGWLKRAESLLALGRRDESRACAEKAARLNPYDFRIRNIKKLLNHK